MTFSLAGLRAGPSPLLRAAAECNRVLRPTGT